MDDSAKDPVELTPEDDERVFSRQLATLVEITNELSMVKTFDDLCRRAVELARERLGFDRLGIWFVTEDPRIISGSFGVDERGRVLDEREKRSVVDPEGPDGTVLFSKEPLVLIGEEPLLNWRGETVGRCAQAFAAIWNGEDVIGHVSMDNGSTGRPITEHQCELLRLFGAAIGYLFSRKRAEEERERVIVELQDALARINTLHGLIPICASCKKIRDDQGYWNQIEQYIGEHSDAEFSHSVCPTCAKELYGHESKKKSGEDS
jgi:GAF domain-containing protein